MIKLYKKKDNKLNYWETWEAEDGTSVVHWGIVGDVGESIKIQNKSESKILEEVKKLIKEKVDSGYRPFDERNIDRLIIEYKVNDHGTKSDLSKRQELEKILNNLLGWTGLGDCDGGSMGSGTMEVFCFVVDFEIAQKVIEEKLKGTEFSDYARIYLEE